MDTSARQAKSLRLTIDALTKHPISWQNPVHDISFQGTGVAAPLEEVKLYT